MKGCKKDASRTVPLFFSLVSALGSALRLAATKISHLLCAYTTYLLQLQGETYGLHKSCGACTVLEIHRLSLHMRAFAHSSNEFQELRYQGGGKGTITVRRFDYRNKRVDRRSPEGRLSRPTQTARGISRLLN
ncbi:hypothetical protein BKA57DRAFT_456968 [Linnemannia elongata]|nr:hypothetical protein BKA57DRAFT_456968 [Linnemannia elongata]